MGRHLRLLALLTLSLSSIASGGGQAAENAAGWYALGTKASMAGFVPPPGIYFVDVNYYYSGDASGTAARGVAVRDIVDTPIGELTLTGKLSLDVDAKVQGDVYYNLPSFLWVAPGKVLGGNVGFGAIVPVGWKDVGFDLDVLAT